MKRTGFCPKKGQFFSQVSQTTNKVLKAEVIDEIKKFELSQNDYQSIEKKHATCCVSPKTNMNSR